MKPKSFSATAIHVAELCTSRFKAEQIDRVPNMQNSAASLGTAVHGALEMFVNQCYVKQLEKPTINLLELFFQMSYIKTFGSSDTATEEFNDGLEMLQKWFMRRSLDGRRIISLEEKSNFPIKTSIGEIPFNYIIDRLDWSGEEEITVVDYKTNRASISPSELKKKIQSRAYSLAIQLRYPQVKRIWVEFDMLRHDGPVGVVFTKDENREFLRFLRRKAQEIVDTSDTVAEKAERLNPECLFCVKKTSCKTLLKNIAGGGVFSIGSAQEAVDLRAELAYQVKAVTSAINDLDSLILTEAREHDILTFESETNILEITAKNTRGVDPERFEKVVGPTIASKYRSNRITMEVIDRLLRKSNTELTDEQKNQLRGLIHTTQGQPYVTAKPKVSF